MGKGRKGSPARALMHRAAMLAERAGRVAQQEVGCECVGLRVGVVRGEFDFHLPVCGRWMHIADAVAAALAGQGYSVNVPGLVGFNLLDAEGRGADGGLPHG